MTLQITQPLLARPTQVRVICEGGYGDGEIWQERRTMVHHGPDYQYTVEGKRRGYDLTVFGHRGMVRLPDDVRSHNEAVAHCRRELAKERAGACRMTTSDQYYIGDYVSIVNPGGPLHRVTGMIIDFTDFVDHATAVVLLDGTNLTLNAPRSYLKRVRIEEEVSA